MGKMSGKAAAQAMLDGTKMTIGGHPWGWVVYNHHTGSFTDSEGQTWSIPAILGRDGWEKYVNPEREEPLRPRAVQQAINMLTREAESPLTNMYNRAHIEAALLELEKVVIRE